MSLNDKKLEERLRKELEDIRASVAENMNRAHKILKEHDLLEKPNGD